jgi:hypothetical protein
VTDGVANTIAQLVGTQLFNRALNLTIGFPNDPTLDVTAQFNDANSKGLDLSGMDVDFVVEKSLKPTEPNTCAIKVYNLSPASREKISGSQSGGVQHALTVRLEAGYVGGVSQIYFAEARSAWTTSDSRGTYVTHIESTDTIARVTGVKRTRKPQPGELTGNIYRTMGPRVPLADAFRSITAALGIGNGNLQTALANMHGSGLTAVNGSALVGNGARRMTDLCRSAGLEWSIQDGNLQLINIGATLSSTKAILISEDTGMEGSPSVDSQGALSVKTRLIPGLSPGVLVSVQSKFINGGYRVDKIRYIGSTRGKEWSAHFDAIKY